MLSASHLPEKYHAYYSFFTIQLVQYILKWLQKQYLFCWLINCFWTWPLYSDLVKVSKNVHYIVHGLLPSRYFVCLNIPCPKILLSLSHRTFFFKTNRKTKTKLKLKVAADNHGQKFGFAKAFNRGSPESSTSEPC